MTPPYRDPDWLERRYHDDGATQREIATECDVSARTIRKYMDRFGIETREIAGENHPLFGQERSPETKRKISEKLEGRSVLPETRKKISESQRGEHLPVSVKEKIAQSLSGLTRPERTRIRMSRSTAGEQNPNWRGGYSRRYGAEWRIMRDRIRERDTICQYCGHDGTKYRLEVHHIVPVRRFREIDDIPVEDAHRPNNLLLLCKRCHGRADHGSISVPQPRELSNSDEQEDR